MTQPRIWPHDPCNTQGSTCQRAQSGSHHRDVVSWWPEEGGRGGRGEGLSGGWRVILRKGHKNATDTLAVGMRNDRMFALSACCSHFNMLGIPLCDRIYTPHAFVIDGIKVCV